jgi:hypothetical protein
MSVIRVISYIAAAILIFFGILFVWGAFDPNSGSFGWIPVGLVSILAGFGLIWFAGRQKAASPTGNQVTVKVDLPGNVSLDTFKCQSCGGSLSPEHVKMVAGAPVVSCPYCHTSYQLTEEPKW